MLEGLIWSGFESVYKIVDNTLYVLWTDGLDEEAKGFSVLGEIDVYKDHVIFYPDDEEHCVDDQVIRLTLGVDYTGIEEILDFKNGSWTTSIPILK